MARKSGGASGQRPGAAGTSDGGRRGSGRPTRGSVASRRRRDSVVLAPSEVRGIKVERKTDRNDDGPNRDYLRVTIEAASGKRFFATDGEAPLVDQARAMMATTFGSLVK